MPSLDGSEVMFDLRRIDQGMGLPSHHMTRIVTIAAQPVNGRGRPSFCCLQDPAWHEEIDRGPPVGCEILESGPALGTHERTSGIIAGPAFSPNPGRSGLGMGK